MRKFKFEQVNSTPYKGLDGTVIFNDGTDPTHKILLEKVDGLGIPQSVVQTQQAPFKVGASPIRVTYGPRTISLECAIIVDCKTEAGKASMESIKRDLGNKFSPVGMGYVPQTSLTGSAYSTVTGKLSYASDGVTYDRFIDCVPISCEFPNRSYSDGFQRFRLALFCPDPTWYGVEQSEILTTVPTPLSGVWPCIAWSRELNTFCALSYNSDDVITSQDGITWDSGSGQFTSYGWLSVCWSPELNIFCAVAGSSATTNVETSPDGITWTMRTASSSANWSSICWSKELEIFCAIAYASNNIMTSPDGITWTARTGSSVSNWRSVCWSSELSLFCAVSSIDSKVQTSPDGITWTARTASSVGGWYSVCWSPELSLFCAVGESSSATNIMTSPDGINWTNRLNTGYELYSVAWSRELELFCAVGGTGIIKTSPDGINWTTRTSSTTYALSAICWSDLNGAFVTVSLNSSQYPLISYDGITWDRPTASDYLEEITNDGDVPAEFEIDIPVSGGETGKVVAIGDNFLWSGTGTPPSDHNLVFGTDGLKKGTVTVSTKFNDKDIRQFGVSKFSLYQQGTFFSLYVSGATTNNIYVRNTGTNAGAPTIRWKNRYLGV